MRTIRGFLVLLTVLVACGGAPAFRAEVTLTEFRIDPTSTVFQAGPVGLDVDNAGRFGHTLVITNPSGEVVTVGDFLEPEKTDTITVDLAPGEYQLTCRIIGQDSDGNVIDHYEEGMQATITVEDA